MADYEQMEIDVRLESEKDLKTNVGKVIKFFYDKRRMEAEESGWPLKQVKGKHEGYGIAAEAFSKIGAKMKALDRGMKDYLALLQVKGEDGVSICGDIYAQALELAMEAIGMAADATRILNDLYYGYDSRTPIEQAIAEMKAQDDQEGAPSLRTRKNPRTRTKTTPRRRRRAPRAMIRTQSRKKIKGGIKWL